jgi:hypothetical protein
MHNALPLDDKSTAKKIAEQSKVGQATVKRAEKFADAVDKVAVGFERLKQLTPSDTIAAIKQSLPNLDKNGGNSCHESRRNLDKTETKIAEQSKVSPKTQSEEDESGVVTVTTPKKTELK